MPDDKISFFTRKANLKANSFGRKHLWRHTSFWKFGHFPELHTQKKNIQISWKYCRLPETLSTPKCFRNLSFGLPIIPRGVCFSGHVVQASSLVVRLVYVFVPKCIDRERLGGRRPGTRRNSDHTPVRMEVNKLGFDQAHDSVVLSTRPILLQASSSSEQRSFWLAPRLLMVYTLGREIKVYHVIIP